MTLEPPQLELLSTTAAEKLDHHAKFIRACINGQRKSAAEMFGYAFLAGHRMLLAKSDLPHGNSDTDLNGGLQTWAEREFRSTPYRTLTRWMEFADAINGQLAGQPKIALLLERHKITRQDRPLILDSVLQVMDGKGMMRFMRDSRLLRDAEKPAFHKRKQVSPDKALAAKRKAADKHWSMLRGDLALGSALLKLLDDSALQQSLDCLVTASNEIRNLLKLRKGSKP